MKKKEMISLNSIFFEFEMNMGVNERIERLDLMEQYVLKHGLKKPVAYMLHW